MPRAERGDRKPPCIRHEAGFCLLALWGNPKCFDRAGAPSCRETDGDAAYARLIAHEKRRLAKDPDRVARILG